MTVFPNIFTVAVEILYANKHQYNIIWCFRKVKKPEFATQCNQAQDESRVMLAQDANEVLCLVQLKGDFREQIKEGCSYLMKGISLSKRLEISR